MKTQTKKVNTLKGKISSLIKLISLGIKKYIVELLDLEKKLEIALIEQFGATAFDSQAAYYIVFNSNRHSLHLCGKFGTKIEAKLFADFYYNERNANVNLYLDEEIEEMIDSGDYSIKISDYKKLRANKRLQDNKMSVTQVIKIIKRRCQTDSWYRPRYVAELENNEPKEYREWKYS